MDPYLIYHLCSGALPGSLCSSVMEFAENVQSTRSFPCPFRLWENSTWVGECIGNGFQSPTTPLLPTLVMEDLPHLPSTLPTSGGLSQQCLPLFLRASGAWHDMASCNSCKLQFDQIGQRHWQTAGPKNLKITLGYKGGSAGSQLSEG